MLRNLFPEESFTVSELNEIAGHLSAPCVRKYLRNAALSNFEAIASGLPAPGESSDAYLLRQAVVVGSNAAIEKLLSIEVAPAASSSPSRS